VKEYLLETDLSEENWTRLAFKDDMQIRVKKAFSQKDGGRRKGRCVTFIHADVHSHSGYRMQKYCYVFLLTDNKTKTENTGSL